MRASDANRCKQRSKSRSVLCHKSPHALNAIVLLAASCPLRLLIPGASWYRKFFVSQTQRSTSRCAKRTNSATHMVPSRRTFAGKYGGRDHAADEAGVEANGSEGSRASAGSRRRFVVADGGRVRGNRRAGTRRAVNGYHIESRHHSQRGRDRRRQPGNVLCLRQGKLRAISGRRAICPRLRLQMRRLQRLRSRLQGLQRLCRLRRLRLRRLRRLRLLLDVGSLPLVLASSTFCSR
jgi:hypothetical protein